MIIFKNFKKIIKIQRTVAAIGIFDGVHIGHASILKKVVSLAKKLKRTSAVITFYPHPKKILIGQKLKPAIISLDHRLKLIAGYGIDSCVLIKFTRSFAKKHPEWFIQKVLLNKLHATDIVVGENFKLGEDQVSGHKLSTLMRKNGIRLHLVRLKRFRNMIASSSVIRSFVEKGDLKTASNLLGKKVSISGRVVKGRRIGRVLGFPTANLDYKHELIPPAGVYAVKVNLTGTWHKAVMNIGFRPTFKLVKKDPTVEIHIIGVNKKLYNKSIYVIIYKRIRPEKHFKDTACLKNQIAKDIMLVKAMKM